MAEIDTSAEKVERLAHVIDMTCACAYGPNANQPVAGTIRTLAAERDRLAEETARLRDALIWCSGSPDFNEGGQAEDGWRKICAPLIHSGQP